MINENLTFKKFGYYSYNLKPFTSKKIIATCKNCNKNREIKKYQYSLLCGKCSRKSKEIIKKISESRKGQHNSPNTQFKKGIKPITGFKKGHKSWNKNIPHTEETKLKMKQNHANVKGKNCHFYIDGRTKLHFLIRNLKEYTQWRNNIFKRDNYTCQECSKTNCYIEAHHIKSFAIILSEFLKNYVQFNLTKDKETLVRLSITYYPFWNINNGKTLCVKCHNKIKGK